MTTTITLTPDQAEIKEVARRFLDDAYSTDRVRELMASDTGWTPEDWEQLAEMGWAGIAVPEDLGGAGYGVVERCVLLEEMGRSLLPGPFFSSAVLGADVLTAVAGAGAERARELLAEVSAGSTRVAAVIAGDLAASSHLTGAVQAVGANGSTQLTGPGGLTVDAGTADLLLVAAAPAEGGAGLFAVRRGAGGVTLAPCELIDRTRRVFDVDLSGAEAERLDVEGDASQALRRALDSAAIGLAAEVVGGAQQVIDMTLTYVKDRKQFGVPVGSFQALKHRLADASIRVDGARELTYLAADVLADGGDAEAVALAAKTAASEAYVHATGEGIQLHGGIGFTWEHDMHLFYKRAICSATFLGTPVDQRQRLAQVLGV